MKFFCVLKADEEEAARLSVRCGSDFSFREGRRTFYYRTARFVPVGYYDASTHSFHYNKPGFCPKKVKKDDKHAFLDERT